MSVKFFKSYEAAEAARSIEIVTDVYGGIHGWCSVSVRLGDQAIEVKRRDFEAFVKEFNRAAEAAIAEYDKLESVKETK